MLASSSIQCLRQVQIKVNGYTFIFFFFSLSIFHREGLFPRRFSIAPTRIRMATHSNKLKKSYFCSILNPYSAFKSRLQQTTFINTFSLFFFFVREIRLDVSSESSARQRIHLKHQVLFSSKVKSKKLKCRLLQFLFGALRVKSHHSIKFYDQKIKLV